MIATIIHTRRLEKYILAVLVAGLVLSCVLYVVSVGRSVVSVVERKDTEREIATIEGEIDTLEFQYLTLRQQINLSYAHTLGFVDTESTYVSRVAPFAVLENLNTLR